MFIPGAFAYPHVARQFMGTTEPDIHEHSIHRTSRLHRHGRWHGRAGYTHGSAETVTPNFRHAIPNIPGKSLTAVVVDYPPGAASPAHRHASSAFIYAYVVSGDIESQVDDGPKRVYHAGESFFEAPGALHRVSRNASATKPAKLLAVFVADSNDTALTTPIN